jgi:hypothetical protein
MERYDYYSAVKEDVKNVVVNEYNYIEELKNDREEFEQRLYDELWVNDSVTGNASGSYTFNAWQAEENICHNMDLLKEACNEFNTDLADIIESAESCDVTIRCYLLNQSISEILDELEEELPEDEEED